MFGARGFGEVAGFADIAGLEEDVVEGVVAEALVVVGGVDVVAAVDGGEVGEEVWAGDEERDWEDESVWKTRNGAREEDGYAACNEREVEDLRREEKGLERLSYLP